MGEGAAWRGAPNGAMGEGVAWRGAPPMSKQNGFVAAYRCYRSPQSPAQRACPNTVTFRGVVEVLINLFEMGDMGVGRDGGGKVG